MSKILVAEDEEDILEIIVDYLKNSGHNAVGVTNGQEAITEFDETFDLVLLDINMPIMDGLEACKIIRAKSPVPIILATARTAEVDELRGLDIGADDYIKKPFSPKVMLARVKSLLKRPQLADDSGLISIGPIKIDMNKMELTKNGDKITLTTNQINILYTLMASKGQVFTREQLISGSYDNNLPPDIYDRTIDAHIKNIRKAIEIDSKNPEYVLTIRGRGYKFNEDIE